MNDSIGDNNDNAYPWYLYRDVYDGPQRRARSPLWSHHASDGSYGNSYYDTASSSSVYDASDPYWSDAEGGTTTSRSSVHSYYRYSDLDPWARPRRRHHEGQQRSASLYSESELTDTYTVWATDEEERSRGISTDDAVSRNSSPRMSSALPMSEPERQPRPYFRPRLDTEFVREEQHHRPRSSVRRHRSHTDFRPRADDHIRQNDHHRQLDDHHDHRHNTHHEPHHEPHHDHVHSHHAVRPHYSPGQAATQIPRRSPTRTIRIVRLEEEEPRCLDACRHRHCHCHKKRKGNMALRFARWTLT